jgi:membrane protease YdiL (CAAX protease family)
MKLSLRNEQGRVRDGWKSFFFILAAIACFVVVGVTGRHLPQALKPFAPSAILIALLGIAITRVATHLESVSLASIGLAVDVPFLRQFASGALAGAGLIAIAALAVCALAGVQLSPAAPPALQAEIKLVLMFLGGAIFEELLFRGYAFQRAARGLGVWPAIVVFGVLFCVGHLPGNLDVGLPLLILAMANIFAAGVLLSLLYLRTGSLALPIGFHVGWNFLQDSLGFGVSGLSSGKAWFHVDLGTQPGWLTGGEFGLEASIIALVVIFLAIGVVATMKPRAPRLRFDHTR